MRIANGVMLALEETGAEGVLPDSCRCLSAGLLSAQVSMGPAEGLTNV